MNDEYKTSGHLIIRPEKASVCVDTQNAKFL